MILERVVKKEIDEYVVKLKKVFLHKIISNLWNLLESIIEQNTSKMWEGWLEWGVMYFLMLFVVGNYDIHFRHYLECIINR